jgi:hypothetical protein
MALVRTDVSEERIASFIGVTGINGIKVSYYYQPHHWLHGVASQKTAFFIVTAVKNSNIT